MKKIDINKLKVLASDLVEVIYDIEAYEEKDDINNAYWLLVQIKNLLPKEKDYENK